MTGAFKVRVDADTWVTVGGAGRPGAPGGGSGGGTVTDTLHVGTSAPTDEAIELWYDTDEPTIVPLDVATGDARYQPLDTDLTALAGLSATTGNMILSVSSTWSSQPPGQVKVVLGLDQVSNTPDTNKPVSSAQQAALDLRVLKAGDTMSGALTVTTGDITASAGIIKARTRLSADNGGGAGAPATQALFTWGGNGQYGHAIATAHDAGTSANNELAFKLWKVGDAHTAPSNTVLSLKGDRTTFTGVLNIHHDLARMELKSAAGVGRAIFGSDNLGPYITAVVGSIDMLVDSESKLNVADTAITSTVEIVLPSADPVAQYAAANADWTMRWINLVGATKAPLRYSAVPTITGTTYTLALTDESKFLEFTAGTAIALSVPTNAVAAFPVGTHIDFCQTGAGKITVTAVTPGTTTVIATPSNILRAVGSAASLIKLATDRWILVGDLT
jgi:hypothetical protein